MRTLASLSAVLLTLLALAVQAATGDFADIPALKARVTDTTGTLSPTDVARIEGKLKAFEQQKGSQMVVLMVPTTQPEAIEQYSIRVAESWKIGRKKVDDGLILLVAKNDRKMRIEVGYGLEGAVPDAIAKRVISEVIAPRFRANDYVGGIEAGVDRLIAVASGEALPAPDQKKWSGGSKGSDNGINIEWYMIAFFVAIGVGSFLRAVFGRFFGAMLTGGGLGAIAWLLTGIVGTGVMIGFVAFVIVLLFAGGAGGGGGGISSGSWSSGSSDWSSGGSDSFSGGGGDFGGGGASGDW
ncbi:MAG: YgcG family protein [Burkholderiales bacterium]|nr:YgcG family protein [Burkholderiales bacterium]